MILFCHCFFIFLITLSQFLTLEVISQTFHLTEAVVIPTGISINEAKAEIKANPVSVKTKINFVLQRNEKTIPTVSGFLLITSLCFISSQKKNIFCLIFFN